MKKLALLLSLLLLSLLFIGTPGAQAQSLKPDTDASGQLNFIWGHPQGDFADNVDRQPVGASLLFGGVVPQSPLFLGTEISLLGFGSNQFLELPRYENIPLQGTVVSTSHSIVMGHLVARLQLPAGPIRPYIDGLAGVRSYVSSVSVDSRPLIFPVGFDSRASTTSWGFSYGGGAGLDLVLYEGHTGLIPRPARISFNFGARYLFGTEADVARLHNLQETDNRFMFDTVRSTTNMIVPQIGIRINP